VERGEDGRRVFLSICVPTYNRAVKLARCLDQLGQIVAASAWRGEIELVISDNESTDGTPGVIASALGELARHCPVRAYRQPANLGAEPNFRFLYERARGEYVWICSDDDVVDAAEFERLVGDLHRFEPEVCISSFANPDSTKDRVVIPGGAEVLLVDDVEAAVLAMRRYGMVTQYVLRRRELSPEEQAVSEAASRGVVWFSALGVMLFTRRSPRLLLRAGELARDYADGSRIRFSPRVYGMITDAVLLGLGDHPARARLERALPVERPETYLVGHLFREVLGRGNMEPEVAREDFRYLLRHLAPVALMSWRNAVKVPVVLALFPVMHRIRARRAPTAVSGGRTQSEV
jgi:glycosyltransferase involved in cell wall biosynthesis